jgi:hypothetical protein
MGLCDIDPVGVNAPESAGSGGKYNIQNMYAGDSLKIVAAGLQLDGEAINMREFSIAFGFSDQLFATPCLELVYTPDEYVDEYASDTGWIDTPECRFRIEGDVVTVMLKPEFTATLRRGAYIFSLRATNLETGYTGTVYEGHVLVKYSPTSAHRDIPYKTLDVAPEVDEES